MSRAQNNEDRDGSTSKSISLPRLMEEHKAWKHDHLKDFIAKPAKLPDGKLDYLHWECIIPGKENVIEKMEKKLFELYYKQLIYFVSNSLDCVERCCIETSNVF